MSATAIAGVTALVEQFGWPVFPCNWKKEPLTTHGFKDATRDVDQIRKWAAKNPDCLWGIPTGTASNTLVLDVDKKNGVDGDEALAALVSENGPLPDTAEVLTTSGGRHLYFVHPGITTKSTAGDLGPGLDVRGDGGYAIIPPSRINGRAYEWEASSDPADVGFAQAPPWLVDLVKADAEKRADDIPGGALDTELCEHIARGDAGRIYSSLVKLSARYVGRRMDRDDVVAALRGLLDDCGWKDKDPKTWRKRYESVPELVASAVKKFGDKREEPPPRDGLELKYVFADQLEGRAVVDEILEELLTRAAISCMYGDSNCGKTFLAIDLACAFALGILWMGRNIEQGFVMYLATEAPGSVEMRTDAYQKHHGVKVPNLCIVQTPINLYVEGADAKLIVDLVRKIERERGQRCILIIGDTLSRIASGANENSGQDMNQVVDRLNHIRAALNAHILLIHHTGKNAALGMRGWSGVRAIIDTEIEVTEDMASGLRAAEVTKQRDIPGKGTRIGFKLQVVDTGLRNKWSKPITSCVVVGTDAPPKQERSKRPSEIAGAITELLTSRGTGMKKSAMADHFEGRYADTSVYRELRKMRDAGKITESVGIVSLVPRGD